MIDQSRTEKHKRNYSGEIIKKVIVNLCISHMKEVLKIIYLNKESKQIVITIMTELKNIETMIGNADYIKNTPSIPNMIQHHNFGNSLVICQNTNVAIFEVE